MSDELGTPDLRDWKPPPERVEKARAILGDAALRRSDEEDEHHAEDEPRPHVAESLGAFLARMHELGDPDWFVRELIPDEGVVIWHGRPRSMKSLTAGDLVLSLALGEPHALGCDRFSIKDPVGCLWLGEEDGQRLVKFRFESMLNARGLSRDEAPDTFRLEVRPGWNLESPHGQAELMTTIMETSEAMATPLRVLLIDPARTSFPGIDGGPKDAANARAFLLTILRETTVDTILLPHHDTKPGRDAKDDRTRAARANGGVTFSMVDLMVNFERLSGRECLAVPTNYKLAADPKPFKVRFESATPDGEGFRDFIRAVAETSDEDASVRNKVLKAVRENDWPATREVDQLAGIRPSTAAKHLAALEAAGLVSHMTGDEAKARGRSGNAVLWGPA